MDLDWNVYFYNNYSILFSILFYITNARDSFYQYVTLNTGREKGGFHDERTGETDEELLSLFFFPIKKSLLFQSIVNLLGGHYYFISYNSDSNQNLNFRECYFSPRPSLLYITVAPRFILSTSRN